MIITWRAWLASALSILPALRAPARLPTPTPLPPNHVRLARSACRLLCGLALGPAMQLLDSPAHGAEHRVRVGIYQNSPKVSLSATGQPEGIFVDLIQAIAAEEGWTLEYVPGTWREGLERLEAGDLDLMPDVALAQSREAVYTFHREPVLSDWFQVFARRGSGIRSVLDLNGKRVSLLERSIQQEALTQATLGFEVSVTLLPHPDYQAAFAAVARGEADAVIANRFYGAAHLREFQLDDTAIIFNPTRLCFAAPKAGHPVLLDAIDRHLARWKADPQSIYYQSLRRWTSEDLRVRLPGWLRTAGLAAAALLLLSLVWVGTLKHQVTRRTRELASRNDQLHSLCEHMKRTEQALRQSEERFRLITENLSDLVALLDLQGCRLYNSPSYRHLLGDPEKLRGSCSFEQIHPDDQERVRASFQRTVRTGVGEHLEYRLVSLTGEVRHIESQGSVIRDDQGQPSKVLVVSRDVTERQRAEQARSETERKYRELVEHANSIILRWNARGHITFLNEFGLRFFGYSAEEILGRHVMGTIVPTSDHGGRDLRRLMEDICANPTAFEQNTNENMRRNGEHVWVAWTNKVVRAADGQVLEILSVGTDVTAQRRADEQIRRLHGELQRHAAHLEQRVAERTKELAETTERAAAADRIKSAFLATMSHELRTPLNSIIGFTGILLQGLAGPLNPEQTKQLDMVRSSARHLLALINDVLDISKIEAGQLRVACAPFDLAASIAKIAGLVSPLAEKKKLTLHVRLAPEVGPMVSDVRRVEQILLNLLNNAIKFTEQGEVELQATATDRVVRIAIRDTGIGIKPDDMATLFQPFRQIDAGLTRSHEGTGLGLAICRRLADLLGGEISAQSTWQQGSTFCLVLPQQCPLPP